MKKLNTTAIKKRVVVIGLDGATFELIKPWLDEGRLPNISNLMNEGVWSALKSVIPPISAPAWVSFMTGKNPCKHGVFGFVDKNGKLISSNSFGDKTLWEILSSNERRVGVVNVPVTYPPKKVNGFLISGFMSPPRSDFTYPKELKDEIPEYKIDVDFVRDWLFSDSRAPQKVNKEGLVREQYVVTEKRASIVLKLMNKYQPDFFIVVFKGTDNLQHYFWDKKDILLEYYKKLDGIIEEIINKSGENANVFVISDHGFGPSAEKIFHVNTWLKEQGLLKVKENLKDRFIRKSLQLAYKIDKKIKISDILPKNSVKKAAEKSEQQIDLKDSKAYAVSGALKGIYINSTGTNGYEKNRDEILSKLKVLSDPETGERIIKKAYKKEDFCSGPYPKHMPDIILLQNPKYNISPFVSEKIITPVGKSIRTGDHANGYLNGIFIANGPDIKRGKQIEGTELIDITPTVLHMMGVPIPEDMDGKVLKEIFKEDSELAKRPIQYQEVGVKDRIRDKIKELKTLGKI